MGQILHVYPVREFRRRKRLVYLPHVPVSVPSLRGTAYTYRLTVYRRYCIDLDDGAKNRRI